MNYKSLYEQQRNQIELIENELGWTEIPPTKEMLLDKIKEMKNEYDELKEIRDKCVKVIKKAEQIEKENAELKEGNVNYCEILNKAKEIEEMCVEKNELIKQAFHTMTKMKKEIEELKKENAELEEANEELEEKNEELGDENVKLKKISNVKTDLINELFSKIVKNADIDDGISISKEYGNKYIDEWNKIYEDIIKDTIKVMNENELVDGGLYLEFLACNCIEFCVMNSDSEEEEEDYDSDIDSDEEDEYFTEDKVWNLQYGSSCVSTDDGLVFYEIFEDCLYQEHNDIKIKLEDKKLIVIHKAGARTYNAGEGCVIGSTDYYIAVVDNSYELKSKEKLYDVYVRTN